MTPDAHPPHLLVLAAGFGTRYGGLKQLDGLGPGGATLLDYAVADASRAGFGGAVIVVRRAIRDAVERHLERLVPPDVPVTLVDQELDDLPGGRTPPESRAKPWGTAHAVWAARRALPGSFVVANADDHYGADAYRVLADHLTPSEPTDADAAGASGRRTDPPPWALATYRLGDVLSPHGPVNRGICRVAPDGFLADVFEGKELERTEGGRVRGRSEEGRPLDLSPDRLVSTNLWAFTGDVFAFLERAIADFVDRRAGEPGAECLIPELVRRGIRAGACRVRVRPTDGDFFGVTHPDDRPGVVARLAERGPPW